MGPAPKFEYWQSLRDEQWYWHLKDGNGRIIAIGGQPFNSKEIVERAIANVFGTVPLVTHRYMIDDPNAN
ncbi:MAG TPA: YegP family protein [Candidatus Saccharimonadales bacterium]|jgi:uncharacterized protein YegP (UPF0339 family)|nr:YegP family protein [Candidatus Saccharimonadales bacterium]